jgi:hypothetical protein
MTQQNPFVPGEIFPEEQFLKILTLASGVQVVWRASKRPHLGQAAGGVAAWIEVFDTGSEDVGRDERRVQPNPATSPPQQSAITIGHRHVTLSCMAYSLTKTLKARDVLARLRFGFNRAAVHDLMQPNISLRWCERITNLPEAEANGRTIWKAHMDVQMNHVVSADTLDPSVEGYALSVNGGGFTPGALDP